jgi:hypothetical protein
MSHRLMTCTFCRAPLPAWQAQSPNLEVCPRCGTQQWAVTFPAALKDAAPINFGRPLQTAEEASCFYHGEKQAEVPCESCGRFLCGLCAVAFRGRTLCPTCLDTGLKTQQLGETRSTYPAYDSVALLLAFLPVIIFPLAIFVVFTAPAALYFGLRGLRGARMPGRSVILRSAIAVILATIQIAAIIFTFGSIANQIVGGGI